MKKLASLTLLIVLLIEFGINSTSAQNYSVGWYKVAGGSGVSTSGAYSVSGTIGQPDASGPMTGGNYSATGGFWSLSAVQMPGAPLLAITRSGNQAIIFWDPVATGWTLQTNVSLAPQTWGDYPGNIVNNRLTNSFPSGNLFFRLRQ